MGMNREPLGGVEQLDEKTRRGAEAGDVFLPEPRAGIGLHHIAEEATVRESREPLLLLVTTGISRRRHGADPVLGEPPVLLGLPAQPSEERSPSIEAVDAGRQQALGAHRRKYREPRARGQCSKPFAAAGAVP